MENGKDRRFWNVYLQVRHEVEEAYFPLRKEGIEVTKDDILLETGRIMEEMDTAEKKRYSELVNKMREESRRQKGEMDMRNGREKLKARCSPSSISSTFASMSIEQQETIKEMGFGKVMELEVKKFISDELSEALDCFDPENMLFSVDGGEEVLLTSARVASMLGLVDEGLQSSVPTRMIRGAELGLQQSEWSIEKLKNYICDHQHSGTSTEWRQRALLYLLAVFFAPTTKFHPTRELVVASTTCRDPRSYAWSKYILVHLKKWVVCYKTNKKKKVLKERHLGGCMYILVMLLRNERKKRLSPIVSKAKTIENQKPKSGGKPIKARFFQNETFRLAYEEAIDRIQAFTVSTFNAMFLKLQKSNSLSIVCSEADNKPDVVEDANQLKKFMSKSGRNIQHVYQRDKKISRKKSAVSLIEVVPLSVHKEEDILSSTAAKPLSEEDHIPPPPPQEHVISPSHPEEENQPPNPHEVPTVNEWAIVLSEPTCGQPEDAEANIDKLLQVIVQQCEEDLAPPIKQVLTQKSVKVTEPSAILTPKGLTVKKRKRKHLSERMEEYYFSPQLEIPIERDAELLWEFALSNRRKESLAMNVFAACGRCMQPRDHNFATTCMCRVPKHLREEKVIECVHCGCRGCASGD